VLSARSTVSGPLSKWLARTSVAAKPVGFVKDAVGAWFGTAFGAVAPVAVSGCVVIGVLPL
jgi:hypothetical protein